MEAMRASRTPPRARRVRPIVVELLPSRWRRSHGPPAFVVARVLGVARAFVVSVLWERTQRTAALRKRGARGRHGIRRDALLHPRDDRVEHVEAIERRLPA